MPFIFDQGKVTTKKDTSPKTHKELGHVHRYCPHHGKTNWMERLVINGGKEVFRCLRCRKLVRE